MFTLPDFARLNRSRFPDDLAVTDSGQEMTYAELIDRAWALADGLHRAGVLPGDTVGVLADNSCFFAEVYLGIACAGAIPVLYNWRWAVPELAFALTDSRAKIVIVDTHHDQLLADTVASDSQFESIAVIRAGQEYERFTGDAHEPTYQSTDDDINVIIYTSGTTGFPKGVMLSHSQAMTNALNMIVDLNVRRGDRSLLITPMFHTAALLCWFLPHFVVGGASITTPSFDEDETGELIEKYSVTNAFLTPTMVRRLIAHNVFTRYAMESFTKLYVGGAVFRLPDKQAIKKILPDVDIYHQYGLTEGAGILTRLLPHEILDENTDGSIGREFLLCEISVRDPYSHVEVPSGEVGELWLRGPGVMTGYYGNPQATAEAKHEDWLRTGDLVSKDANGYFYMHDRLKDMIKSGGENVYSAEVERILYAHPAILEAAVIGVPSDEWDEEVCAVIALKPGIEATVEEIKLFCRGHLAGYKIPKRIKIVTREQLPINDIGKLMKKELRDRKIFQ